MISSRGATALSDLSHVAGETLLGGGDVGNGPRPDGRGGRGGPAGGPRPGGRPRRQECRGLPRSIGI